MRRALILFAAFVAGACGGGDADSKAAKGGGPSAAAKPRGTLIFTRQGDASDLDPAVATDGESVMVTTNVFDTLVTTKPGTIELVPGLADKWTRSPDGLKWTFHLREAKFHDGTQVDADAVVFSFLRQKDPNHPAHVGDFGTWEDLFGSVTDVVAVDPRTVEIRLDRPFAPFLSTMAIYAAAIVSPTAWKSEGVDPATGKYKYKFTEKPVGSGPFKFVRWTRKETIVLAAFDGYWGGPPGCATVIFKVVKEPDKRLLDIENEQSNLMIGLAPQHIARVRENPKLALEMQPGINIGYLAMNCAKKPFDDVRVRQAVAFALSKEKIKKAAYDGQGDIAVTPCPTMLPGHLAIDDRKQDVEKAKKLLAEAGFPNGFETTLWCGDISRAYMPAPSSVATQIQQDLERVGVRVKTSVVPWTQYLKDTKEGKHDMCLLGWMCDYGDTDDYLYVLLDKDNAREGTASNVSFYKGEKYHELVNKARYALDDKERVRLYEEAQRIVFDEVPMVPLMSMPDIRVRSPKVKGYSIFPAGGEWFHDVTISD